MAFRFSRDGALFPCEARNGELVIHVADDLLRIPVGFIKEDYPLEYSDFSTSNIMCYMENEQYSVVMRFDGTITKYTKEDVVIGFGKFNLQDIYDKMLYLPVGAFRYPGADRILKCSVYRVKEGTQRWVLTISGNPRLHIFDPALNKQLTFELMQGNRNFPGLTLNEEGILCEDTYAYVVNCEVREPISTRNI